MFEAFEAMFAMMLGAVFLAGAAAMGFIWFLVWVF